MQTKPTLTTDANSYQVITMVENQEIRAVETDTATKTYYLVVWISETGREQNDTGTFTGSITFEPTIYTSYVLEKQTDSGNFLSTSIPRNQIDSLSFINTADAPTNSIDVLDVSLIDDNSVQLYYTDNGNTDAYEVMIGTENGTVVASSGYKLFSRLGLPEKLTIDLTNLDTSRVIDMSYMFEDFKAASLSFLSSFDTSNVIDMNYMFGLCGQLETISLSDKFKTTKVVDSGDMFMWCYDLRGGTGTTYDENHTNATYARIDIESTPGYFTLKST